MDSVNSPTEREIPKSPAIFLSTSTPQLWLWLRGNSKKDFLYTLPANRHLEVELPRAFTALLQESSLSPSAIQSVILDAGPGSFTGLRVGFSFIKGFTAPFRPRFYPISSLDCLALSFLKEPPLSPPQRPPEPTLAVLRDAKRERIYCARYALVKKTISPISPPQCLPLSSFVAEVAPTLDAAGSDEEETLAQLARALTSSGTPLPLHFIPWRPSPHLFSQPLSAVPRLQLTPLYLQSFPE